MDLPHPPCTHCGKTDTSLWRRGPDGAKSLCNACGVHYMRHKTLENKSKSPGTGSRGKRGEKSKRGPSNKSRKRRLDSLGEVVVTKRRGKDEEESGRAQKRSKTSSTTSTARKGGKAVVLDDDEAVEYDAFAFLEDFLSLLSDGDNEEVADAFLSHLDYMDVADLVRAGEGLQIMSNAIIDQLAARATATQQNY